LEFRFKSDQIGKFVEDYIKIWKYYPIVFYFIGFHNNTLGTGKKTEESTSHYDDQTIENLKNYYKVEEHHSSDLLRFIKTHGTRHDSDDNLSL
jgi:hypothetical protein